jgi:hypothetical protein
MYVVRISPGERAADPQTHAAYAFPGVARAKGRTILFDSMSKPTLSATIPWTQDHWVSPGNYVYFTMPDGNTTKGVITGISCTITPTSRTISIDAELFHG